MKKISTIIIAAMAAFAATSCGSTIYMAENYQIDDIRNVMMFEPVSKIETIGKKDIAVTDELGCIASENLVLKTFEESDRGLNILSVYSPDEAGRNQIRKDVENIFAQHLELNEYQRAGEIVVPANIDNILERTGSRYGMVVYCYGFSRTAANYAGELAKEFALTFVLGQYAPSSYKDKSNIYIYIIDSKENKVVYHDAYVGPDYNPLKPKHIQKQVKVMTKRMMKQ